MVKLKHVVGQIVEPDQQHDVDAVVVGEKMVMQSDASRYFQNPCPPKFNVVPQRVRDTLAPCYETTRNTAALEDMVQDDLKVSFCVLRWRWLQM